MEVDIVIPIITLTAAALMTGLLMVIIFQRRGRNLLAGFAVGAMSGAIGSLIFMLPLRYCTFEADRSSLDALFGIGLIGLGSALVSIPAMWIYERFFARKTSLTESMLMADGGQHQGAFKGRWIAFLFLAPTLLILALFLYYPAFDTFSLSTLLARTGAPRTAFVCVNNFTMLIEDPKYHQTVLITFGISIATIVIGLSLSLLIATMAYLPIKGASIYRTLLIWPYAISPVVAGLIFLLLFNPTGGIINYALNGLFGFQIPWLNNPTYAPWAVIIASVWKSLGYNILFYLAGLQNVPTDLIEAASIDGANALQRFRRIVIPMLSPITFFLVATNLTYAFFETFGTIDAITPGGGPLDSTTTMMYRIYETGISNGDLGKAAAQSIVLFILVIGLTALQFRTTERRVTYGA